MFTPIVPNYTRWYPVESSRLAGKVCDKCGKPSTMLQLWEQPDTGASAIRCGRDRCALNPLPSEDDAADTLDGFEPRGIAPADPAEFEALRAAFRPCVDPVRLQRDAFVADLEMVVANLRDLQAKGRAACPEPGGDPRREGKWEGSYLMLMGILRDELEPMLEAWKEGGQFSRVGEELVAKALQPPDL